MIFLFPINNTDAFILPRRSGFVIGSAGPGGAPPPLTCATDGV